MKILLRQAVQNVGRAGEIVEVSDAYARNFLIPRNIGSIATAKDVQAQAARLRQQEESLREQRAVVLRAQAQLQGQTIHVVARGEAGKHLYQAVHQDDVLAAIRTQFGLALVDVALQPSTFKQAGVFPVALVHKNGSRIELQVVIETTSTSSH